MKEISIAAGAVMLCSPAFAGHFMFTTIGIPNEGYSTANAISDTNVVVGQLLDSDTSSGRYVGFLWANGATTVVRTLYQPRAASFQLLAVNSQGIAVGTYNEKPSLPIRSFVYNANRAQLRQIEAPPGYALEVHSISDSNIIAGNASLLAPSSPFDGFIGFHGKPVQVLAAPSATSGIFPYAVDNAGEIVGSTAGATRFGFSYLNGTFTQIDPPPGAYDVFPTFIKSSGLIGGYYDLGTGPANASGRRGFLLRGSHRELVSVPQATDTTVVGVSGDGAVIGWYDVFNPATGYAIHGFVHKNGVFSSFDFPGAVETFVISTNNQGSVTGTYADAQGQYHAFIGICAAGQAPCTQ